MGSATCGPIVLRHHRGCRGFSSHFGEQGLLSSFLFVPQNTPLVCHFFQMADNEEKLEKPLVPPAAKPPTPKAMKKAKPKVPLALLTTREQKAAVRVITELQSELVVWKAAAREQRRAVREQLRDNNAIRNALTALKSNA
eukprot:1937373-Pyramimonas_sp.AAC.1